MISQQSSATKDRDKDISRDINIDDLSIKSKNQIMIYKKLNYDRNKINKLKHIKINKI